MPTDQAHSKPVDFALTLSDASPFYSNPATLPDTYSELQGLHHVRAVGTGLMSNEHVYRLENGERAGAILEFLKNLKAEGVSNAVLLEKKQRVKRDEF